MKKIITTAYFGMGVGICLFMSNSNLPQYSYFAQVPFWMFFVNPLGSFWN